jgi:hypothetical protein
MNALKNFALLQPVDNKWCPLDFQVWRAGMLVANGSMVATEAPAWGFVASVIFGGGTLACIAGCIVALIMGGLIWTADAGIATADLKSARRFSLMAGARILFLIVSVAFTARYIATFVLTADIHNEWNKRNIALLQQKRAELFNKKVDDLNHAIGEKHQALDLEVEGRRKSGTIGCGSICKQLQADLTDLNSQLDKVRSDQSEFDHLAANPEANAAIIAAKYGLVLPPLTMKVRNEILADLTKQPGYRATELTVRAWCVLLFLGLILAKCAQPDSAKLVYMQSLRPWISKYEAGELDPGLLPPYRSTTVPFFMTLAYLFEYVNQLRTQDKEREMLGLVNEVKSQVQSVRIEAAEAEKRVEFARQTFTESRNRRDALQDGIASCDRSLSEIDMARGHLGETAFSPQRVHETVELSNFEQATLRQREGLRRELESSVAEVARHKTIFDAEEHLLASIKERMWQVENELQTMQWSVAKAASTKFARLVAGDSAPATPASTNAVGAEPQPHKLSWSLVGTGKAIAAGLLEGRGSETPTPASLLGRTVSAYFRSKLFSIGAVVAVVALICMALIVSSFFAHSVLAQLH